MDVDKSLVTDGGWIRPLDRLVDDHLAVALDDHLVAAEVEYHVQPFVAAIDQRVKHVRLNHPV